MRVPARDGIKRIIIIAFFFAASAVEFGTYPVASVVEFRVQAPRFATSSHKENLSARARARARDRDAIRVAIRRSVWVFVDRRGACKRDGRTGVE